MRDLEQEQRQINDALSVFLENMQDHVAKLPDVPELQELRESAEQFLKDVRESKASDAMTEAESALAEFAGTRGHKKAKEAADILDNLIQKCDGMGNGPGDGSGMNGEGAMGLYGGLPVSFGQIGDTGHGPSARNRRGVGSPKGANPDDLKPGELFAPGAATGGSEGSVPVRYRRQVGDYFQRVAEETGEGGH
jgi:hypothetical protein